MSDLLGNPDRLNALYAACGIAAFMLGWFKLLRPKWRRFWDRLDGTLDTLNGRPEYVDPATGRHVEAIPPLGTRMGNMEQALLSVVDQHRVLENHEVRIRALEDAD